MADAIKANAPDHAARADQAMPHYGAGGLIARAKDTLRLAGLLGGVIPWDALTLLDQFHVGGAAAATALALAARLGIGPGARLLDIGCGLDGPARHLASVLYEEVNGRAVFEYDLPSTLFGQFADERVTHVAEALDRELDEVLRQALL